MINFVRSLGLYDGEWKEQSDEFEAHHLVVPLKDNEFEEIYKINARKYYGDGNWGEIQELKLHLYKNQLVLDHKIRLSVNVKFNKGNLIGTFKGQTYVNLIEANSHMFDKILEKDALIFCGKLS